jgi:hypothetical protein
MHHLCLRIHTHQANVKTAMSHAAAKTPATWLIPYYPIGSLTSLALAAASRSRQCQLRRG